MTVADPGQSFQCLACKSPRLLESLPSLQLHFATEHGVVNLLSSRATQAVLPPASFSRHAHSCKLDEFFASCLFCGATDLHEEEMKEHLGSRHGLVFQQDWKQFCSKHCRCYATVQCGWGTEIQTIKPKLKKKKVTPSEVKKARQVLDPVQEEAVKSCQAVGRSGSQVALSLNLGNEEQDRDILHRGAVEEPSKSMRIEVLEEEKVIDSIQEGVVESCKEVGQYESQETLSLNLEKNEQEREMLYREVLKEPKTSMRGEDPEEQKVKRQTSKKSFTRALTGMGGKLLKDIKNDSGAFLHVITSPGRLEEVVLSGPSKSVDKAEQMLKELLSYALEISLSAEESYAVARWQGGKGCLLNKLQGRLQVPVQLQGRKLVLIGKPATPC